MKKIIKKYQISRINNFKLIILCILTITIKKLHRWHSKYQITGKKCKQINKLFSPNLNKKKKKDYRFEKQF